MENSDNNPTQLGGCFIRMLWMGIGNLVVVLVAIGIFQNHAGFGFTSRDVIYWIVVFGLLAIRYVDIRFFNGKTSDNQPATLAHWVRYTAEVLAISLVLWLVMHLISIP
jgi:hypothetical protein